MVSLGGEVCAFPPGSMVQFKTIHDVQIEGKVICFDPSLKVLVIRSIDDTSKKPIMRLYNLSMISEIKETEGPTGVESIENMLANCSLNVKKTNERIGTMLAARSQEIMPSDNVDLNGQRAFLQIKRTIADTRWEGPNIRVVGLVIVRSPYTGESAEIIKAEIHNDADQTKAKTALNQVKKILSKPFNVDDRLRSEFTASLDA
ncbi:unnamed protein product [Caenorhabditis bovis]|uniref:AD domain-containing protein n=1 Tax=Caenorhabditis bovis TaxID=2654633 RepID=A0A8S1EQ90_9PELO|nr:unnamed protein product [Caenorhabditis bovis]